MGPSVEDTISVLISGVVGMVLLCIVFALYTFKDMWLPWVLSWLESNFAAVEQPQRVSWTTIGYDETYEHARHAPPVREEFPVRVSSPPFQRLPDVIERDCVKAFTALATLETFVESDPPIKEEPVVDVPVVESPLYTPVNEWIAEVFDVSAHIVILAGSGSGKTVSARRFVRHIVADRNERVIILDPKACLDTWLGFRAVTQAAEIDQRMLELMHEFNRRLTVNATLTEEQVDQAFERVWIVVDEVSFINEHCQLWKQFLRRISSMARSLKMHLVIVNQSSRVEELGLKGRGDLIANFTKIRQRKGGWKEKTYRPIKIAYDDLTVDGEWVPFPEDRSALSESAWYTPPPIEEGVDVSLSPDASRALEFLQEWDGDSAPSLNALKRKMNCRFDVAKAAASQLQHFGLIDGNLRLLDAE